MARYELRHRKIEEILDDADDADGDASTQPQSDKITTVNTVDADSRKSKKENKSGSKSESKSESKSGSRKKSKKSKKTYREEDEDEYTPWVDVLRVLSFLLFVSCGLSYLASNGQSFFWELPHRPRYLRLDWWTQPFRGMVHLTPDELAAYDGTDPEKPIYLAINGTIYDVTKGAGLYGPAGHYHFFAACDASRAYVTGCFAEDRTADLRGAEQMFLPLDDPNIDARWTPDELAERRRQELAEAKQEVQNRLEHWVHFFEKSPKYAKVGYVQRDPDWLDKEPEKQLCASALKKRKPRQVDVDEEEDLAS